LIISLFRAVVKKYIEMWKVD